MKTLLSTLALALAASLAWAQPVGPQLSVPMTSGYNLASTSYIYCSTGDTAGNVWSQGIEVAIPVTTSGASSTVAAVTASSAPFTNVAVGDELLFNLDGITYRRYVTARASADSITISGAPTATINLGDGRRGTAGYGFYFRRRTCDTTATTGWFPVRGRQQVSIAITVETINATSIDVTTYCRSGGSLQTPVEVDTKNYTAADGDIITLAGGTGGLKWEACRVGMKVNTDTGDQSVTVVVEG
jgi:hypothetical protein